MELTISRPDDWHVHLRDGAALATVVPHVAARFGRAIVMPNLVPPITTTEQALSYRDRIVEAIPAGLEFQPLMTLYLTDNTSPAEIARARGSGAVVACKLYPAGATTNSDAGVTSVDRIHAALDAMESEGLLLLVHGEVTRSAVDIFDREARFLEEVLAPLVKEHPGLRVVLEHITTRDGVDFVRAAPERVGGTVTAHHLLHNRNDMLVGGVRPHLYCLPVLKREEHRRALVEAATGDDRRFFLGTDSAPHPRGAKESPCGCAGCYTSHAALELYAEAFDAAGALDRLEDFASFRGADFYGLPRGEGTITLIRRPRDVPETFPFGDETVVPLRAGATTAWSLAS